MKLAVWIIVIVCLIGTCLSINTRIPALAVFVLIGLIFVLLHYGYLFL